jgi:asparagine synthetase B (glutamine-hydrolysing)
MCGIVGFIGHEDSHSFKELLLEAVLHLSHRGPNDSGFFWLIWKNQSPGKRSKEGYCQIF